MAKETLTIQISPALKNAIGIQATDGVDYFTLLGVPRTAGEDRLIDQGIMERSKALRKWQSSPQYQQEVSKLLTVIHRAGKILKDPPRRQAYIEELERSERGETANPVEQFTDLVRAAMADNQLDIAARRELTLFAGEHGISTEDAQKILVHVREEMKAQREAEAARAKEGDWEFRIAEEGEEGFTLTLNSLETSGEFTEQTPAKMIAEAGKYAITSQRAAQILVDFQKYRFKAMIQRVARGRIISDAQTRLLLGKAESYGLDQRQAYDIMADYTLSAHSTDDALRNLMLHQTFSQEEIGQIVGTQPGLLRRGKGIGSLMPDWIRNLILMGVGVALLAFAVFWLQSHFTTVHPDVTPPPVNKQVNGPPDSHNVIFPPGMATPPIIIDPGPLVNKPDPASGMLVFKPEKPGDPPLFEMMITEVTCADYQEFMRATLEDPPATWTGGQPPAGATVLPVTGIPWSKAMAYCTWLCGQRKWSSSSVTLPSRDEYLRATRGRSTRGQAQDRGYWVRAKLGTGSGPAPIKQTQFDKLFFPGGQMYDLMGNVAEWSRDEKEGQRAILGGDYAQTSPDFNPLEARWLPPDTASATIGFRVVHHPPQ